jgi:hypothetical protein
MTPSETPTPAARTTCAVCGKELTAPHFVLELLDRINHALGSRRQRLIEPSEVVTCGPECDVQYQRRRGLASAADEAEARWKKRRQLQLDLDARLGAGGPTVPPPIPLFDEAPHPVADGQGAPAVERDEPAAADADDEGDW